MGNCFKYVLELARVVKIHKIAGKKIRELKHLAEGGYGYVVLVEDTQNRKKYAMKKLICQTPQQKYLYQHQVTTLKELSHCKHIVKYYGTHQIQRDDFLQTYILMELGQKTLYDYLLERINKKQSLTQKQIRSIVLQIAYGLKQMHDCGITHQDVKVENVLFVQGKAKLCDLGSSTKRKVNLANVPKSQMYKYQESFQKHTTLMYRPPEMVDLYLQYPVDQRVDTWMLGCVVYVMNYGYHPFQEQGKLSIVNAAIKYPKKVSDKMEKFMREMLTPNPMYRPRMGRIIQILQKWQIQNFQLNDVAQRISDNQRYQQNGQYQKINRNQWRSLKPSQDWGQFQQTY